MTYKPEPTDTSDVRLPEGLCKLIELLAQNNHDIWAQQRIAEQWEYGPERDDIHKKHPDLMPYSDLPESEKDYDRITVMEILKTIVALGYRIERPPRDSSSDSDFAYSVIAEALEQLKSPAQLNRATLLSIWEYLSSKRWAGTSEIYKLLGNRFLKFGEPLLAYDVINEGLMHWRTDLRLRQLLGLALARSGANVRANNILLQLYKEGHRDGETLGILARTHKDFWEQATDSAERKKQLKKAYKLYHEGYRLATGKGHLDDALYTGINATTTALLMGEEKRARIIARRVRKLCLEKLQQEDDYWAEATLGEAAIVLGNWSEAEERYFNAAELGRGNYADLSATRRQARFLVEYLGEDRHRFDHCFGIPKILLFAGHMIDQPGRPQPRFPQELEKRVRMEIAARLKKYPDKIGYSGAACGSDILFLEEMLKQKSEIYIVLPFPREEFQKTSVDIVPGADWMKRFRRVLKQAARVIVASEYRVSGGLVAYEFSNRMQDGLSRLRAQILDTEMIPLVVWNGLSGDGPGGTASMVKNWRLLGPEPEVIDIAVLLRESIVVQTPQAIGKPVPPLEVGLKDTPPGFPQEIMAMMFADVVGYSKLNEEQIPRFLKYFMGEVADLSATSLFKPTMAKTWGDALYFVFKSVGDAGKYTLDLCERLCSTNWVEKELPKNLNLRFALHAGPLFFYKDVVTGEYNYAGSHVNWVSRIEPITPPGQVYASETFAALAMAEGVKEFSCDYVGQTPLAKEFGIFPTYHVRKLRV